jgi:hypothetical protein
VSGCATDSDPELREVGLVGCHAYSLLDVRELELSPESGVTALSGVGYDPHGRLHDIRRPTEKVRILPSKHLWRLIFFCLPGIAGSTSTG